MTYEPDRTPEEWGEVMAEALWAVLTPEDVRLIRQTMAEEGREGVRRHVDRNLRRDMANRAEYVDATVEAFVEELKSE